MKEQGRREKRSRGFREKKGKRHGERAGEKGKGERGR